MTSPPPLAAPAGSVAPVAPSGPVALINAWVAAALRPIAATIASLSTHRPLFPFSPTRRLALVVLLTAPIWLWPSTSARGVGVHAPIELLTHHPGLLVVVLLALAYVADAAATPGRRQLSLRRTLSARVGVGDTTDGTYAVLARWPLTLPAEIFDAFPPTVTRRDPPPQRLKIGRAERVVSFSITGRDRGDFPLGPVVVRVRGPLGLVTRTMRLPSTDRITIVPSVARLGRYELLALQYRLREVGSRTLRRRGEGTSFAGLRDYVVGDDPRLIDWKATARRRHPVTREFSIEQGQTLMILVDAGRLMTQLAGPLPRFEYALSSALILANVASRSGDNVGLLVFDDQIRAYVPPGRGPSTLRHIRDALVPVQPTLVEPDYAAAFRTLADRHRRRSLLVLFTDVIDVRASRALIAHTARGARTHLPLVVALRNDAVLAAASPTATARTTTDSLYESAAAEELLSARDEALERMRRSGVNVLDVAPTAMTAGVVNRYLELKGRGAI